MTEVQSLLLVSPSYFKLQVRWLCSLTRITCLSKLIWIPSLAAFLQLELFRGDSREVWQKPIVNAG
ncbi:hypothetical protein CS369_20670 [Candidatus Symbiopectobacterium sp. 'North America']|nr:hypothetical protein [Candidatus Symbiopectobacterium sp. 'North America']